MAGDSSSVVDWATSVNGINILNNIASSLLPVQRLISGACYVIGVIFALKALYTLKAYGEQRTMMSSSHNIKEPLMYLAIAGCMIYFPSGVSAILSTLFGNDNILQYSSVSGSGTLVDLLFGSGAGRPIVIIIQTIGVIAFVRGWMQIARSSSSSGHQPGGTGKGLAHIVGGVLAINIVATLNVINNTIYGT